MAGLQRPRGNSNGRGLDIGSNVSASGLSTADVATEAVLRNKLVVGTVNANKRHWYKGGQALARADRSWLSRLISRCESPENFDNALQRKPDDIKVVIQFAEA
jgi:threonine dehydrogenase-like Zn-dependent dehydrogenase